MAEATSICCIDQIGDTAGLVWACLHDNGPMSLAKLTKELDATRDVVMQSVGWLAREGKVEIQEKNRARFISLK